MRRRSEKPERLRNRAWRNFYRSFSSVFSSQPKKTFSVVEHDTDKTLSSERIETGRSTLRDNSPRKYISLLNQPVRVNKRRSNSAPNRYLFECDIYSQRVEPTRNRHRGRPLHEILHTECRKSLLSTDAKDLDLKGFVNLVFVILVVINFRMVVYNFRKYGLLMEIPRGFTEMYEDWPLLRCTVKTHICIIFAWAIERFIAPLSTTPLTIPVVLLQGLNLCIVLFYPYLTVVQYKTEPSLSALTLATSILWALKMYSFHHVCYDYRKSVCNGDNIMDVCKNRMEAKIASTYPLCIQLLEFYRFIIMPTVCFQFYYPMTPRINWMDVLKNFLEFTFFLAVIKILADQYIVVTVTNTFTMEEFKSANFFTVAYHIIDRMLLLSIPILYCWLIMFVVLFHYWCNLLAEITRFGDRKFYGDWWNASCFAEYWRKWNLPIHQFIVRHISKPLYSYGLSWGFINIVVFVFSAALHEYLISVPLGLGWTGYVFWAMMSQIPLLLLTEMESIRKNRVVGNVLFWCLFCITGQPVRLLLPFMRKLQLGVLLYWYLWGVKQGSTMQEDILKVISDRLNSTIKETDELYAFYGIKKVSTESVKQGSRLKKINQSSIRANPVSNSHRLGLSSYDRSRCLDNESVSKALPPTTSIAIHANVLDKFVTDAEYKMHLESLRLQDEYNKQLASKLAIAKREMHESNEQIYTELQELHLEKGRWACNEIETRKSLSLVSGSLASLQKSYDNLRTEVDTKNSQVIHLNGELANRENTITTLKSSHTLMEKELHAKTQRILSLQSDITDLYAKLELESSKFSSASKDVSSLNASYKELNEEYKDLKVKYEALVMTNSCLSNEKESLINRTKKIERELSDMTKEALTLQSRIRSKEISESTTIVSLREKVLSLEETLRATQTELALSDKRRELATMEQKVASLNLQIETLKTDNDLLTRENSTLEKQLASEKNNSKEYQNELFATKCQLNSLKCEMKARGYVHQNIVKRHNTEPLEDMQERPHEEQCGKCEYKKRDLFAPTMFDGPDAETQEKIDALERELTKLQLEKDKLESEMVRCKLGVESTALERRRHFTLEQECAKIRKDMQTVCSNIKQLYNN
ncbi:diacylglycerol O-acyltransferase, putative [Theileria equi strain WA]|uniref:diacylglycerol O-acyltransferase n=1 Tax=Theileria equi strain WA TaxID=1537102 RepID=L0AXR7_THEEQ|nr:diacylglycerol O-acyltransferase, putative [Theileria equi strain WA]AFZ80355.1 diacylglycerol O-acyltransferase, putative [Theileria equi strain WA]|eukprot:XP_004830021.1 diacylglycerol O-acyltransferase, putative [Theileria equi strain WA]